jgi:RHS repeat-associated protein
MLATEYDGAGAVKQSYRYDPLGQPAATKTGAGAVFYYHHDTQGSPVDVTSSTDTLHQRWAYDPYGTRVLNTVTSGAPASTPSYTGARYEATTGNLDLHARQYNTTTGRFNRPDPAARNTSTSYVSAYAYADNVPTLLTDPSGLTPDDPNNEGVDSFGEFFGVFGDAFVDTFKSPFVFLGDAYDAFTGENGGAGAFVDKYLPVRPAYRLYRASFMLYQQGCDALSDLYAEAAEELAVQVGAVGVGGLTGWRRQAYEAETSILNSGGIAPRDSKGKYAKRDGEEGRDGSNDELTTWENLMLDGATVIQKEVPVQAPGFKVRKYDGLIKINGRWYGIETKGGNGKRNPDQKKFDDWLNQPGNTVTTKDGKTLVGVFDSWIPPGSMKSREHLDD